MSRKNIAIAGLLTAVCASALIIGVRSSNDGTVRQAGVSQTGISKTSVSQSGYSQALQEHKLKKTYLSQDVKTTESLTHADAGRDLKAMLSGAAGQSADKIAAYARKLQRSHGHIAMLMWIDFSTGKASTFKSVHPKGTPEQERVMKEYLSAAKVTIKRQGTYESPAFTVGDKSYFLMGQRSSDGRYGVIGLIDRTVLKQVTSHQQKNLRLIPYPKEGRFRVESVHTDTLRDITVKTGHDNENASHYYENEVVVRFRNGAPDNRQLEAIAREIHGSTPRKLGYAYIFRSSDMTYPELKAYFESRWRPQYTEPHYMYLTNDTVGENMTFDVAPNDMLFSAYQWNLPVIETGKGWNLSRGSDTVPVAVVDTGVQADHPDLKGQLLTGYNAISGSGLPDDDVGHGTHVTGIIGALVNNGEGVAGISWYNKILPVKVLDNTGAGTTYSVAEGIIWAADHGAKVINLSLGNYADSQFLHDAIKYAYNKDVVLVSASGNDNTERPGYPAAYPEVLAVAATTASDERADFSNYGDYVDVSAPGESIASTYIGSQYAALSGTSMASPHAAALAGLVRSLNPDLTNKEVMDLMTKNAVDLGAKGHDKYFGWGRLDVYRTLQAAAGEGVAVEQWPQHVQSRLQQLQRRLKGLM